MRYYIGIIHKDEGSDFGISFPDFPGCVSAGSDLSELASMGEEALRGHITLMADEGQAIPEPSSMDVVMQDPANRDGTPVLVPAPAISAKVVRVNITLPEDALRKIDQFAEAHGQTRSGFLVAAAKRVLEDA
jgi:predicted RNase H-like HicB family nuclease